MAEARRRRAVLLLLAGAMGVAVVGCASDYRYVNNSQEKAFFRLPADVEVFRVRTEEPTDRPVPLDLSPTEPWVVVFDAADEPSVDHAGLAAPTDPVGRAVILPVGFETGEQLSVKAARSQLAGGEDPLDTANSGEGEVEIVSFESINEGSLVGSHVVYSVKVDETTWTTRDQTSLIDIAGQKVYFFEVKCESSCFKANRDQISQIVDSWQVRK
jgi:hypothetical protein